MKGKDEKSMAQVLNLNPLKSSIRPESKGLRLCSTPRKENGKSSWFTLQQQLKCNGKFTCIFSGSNHRKEEARKAIESALGGKKNEFEIWNEEIKKREEVGGGGDAGGGGLFGWGRRFGWSNGDHFWPEVQQIGLAILGIVAIYLLVAKGEMMLAIIINPWLNVLRGTKYGLTFVSSRIFKKRYLDFAADLNDTSRKEILIQASAKERVLRKWGCD